jgi:(S)-2-hydroxyglutarate dehydrogenase
MAERAWDIAIIGGGIVGLATALELLGRRPGLRLVILEKEGRIGRHQTGHNSGVLHSGIYYAPGSLKARLCVAGKEKLIRFCEEHGIIYDMVGKVIVATDEEELPRLQSLYERGLANGVPGLELVGPERLREIEPRCVGIKAIYSPATGIVDYGMVADKYAELIEARGGEIRTHHEVTAIERRGGITELTTPVGAVETRFVISCAGLYADRVARLTGGAAEPRIVPFRGDYYMLKPELGDWVKGNIYPVPDPRFPFLGVHFTRRINGDIWLGPNAVLAFAREGYRLTDINVGELAEALRYRGFQQLATKFWRTGLEEMYRDVSKRAFLASLQRYMPELLLEDMIPGPSGVRAQALAPDGSLVDDFIVDRQGDTLHVRNAPSPAATSSLAIGELIADAAEETFALEKVMVAV